MIAWKEKWPWKKKKETSEPQSSEKGYDNVEELARLVEQVKILAESVQLLITRNEQLFKLQEERLGLLPQLVENQGRAVEELEVVTRALEDSIGGIDQAATDVAKATSSLLTIVQPALTALAKAAVEQQ